MSYWWRAALRKHRHVRTFVGNGRIFLYTTVVSLTDTRNNLYIHIVYTPICLL